MIEIETPPDALDAHSAPLWRRSESRRERLTPTTHSPDWLWAGRVPGLDGLRALAVGLVVLNHSYGTQNAPFPAIMGTFGAIGVQLFFVISGFLITLLLIREQRRHGAISLGQFYLRRAVRILPALVAFLLFVVMLQACGIVFVDARNWQHIVTFTHNLQAKPFRQWEVAHLWSLCIEEHFYLVWPPLVAWFGLRWSWAAAWFFIVTAPLWRWLVGVQFPGTFNSMAFTPGRMDSIAMGACLAIALTGERGSQWTAFIRKQAWVGWVTIFGLLATVRVLSRWYGEEGDPLILLRFTLTGAALLILVGVTVCAAPRLWMRLLNAKGVVWLGALSYSLYLWQQPFLNRDSSRWTAAWPVNLVIATLLATCSYQLLEKPLLRWRSRFGSVAG